VAVTADDDRFRHVRERAVQRAADDGADVVLYDIDAGSRLLESPRPTNWSADGEEEQFAERLDANDLEALGRRPLADQVRNARSAGVEAWGWLPDDADPGTLREYARRHGASVVMVPSGEERFAEDLGVPVEVIEGNVHSR
jgi:hypothetical protein